MSALPSALAEVVIGSLFVAIGSAAAGAGLSASPKRERTAISFGVFCILYGVRLTAKSDLVRSVIPWPDAVFDYIEAFVTYSILIPAGLFIESLGGPGWHNVVRRGWQLTSVYAVAAAANDLVRHRPYASMWLNPPILITLLVVAAIHRAGLPRTGRWSREVRLVAAAAAIFAFTAAYETLSRGGLFGTETDAEPFAMLLFTAALGWFVLTRSREQAYGFAALARELQLAREIQQSLLPRVTPDVPGLRIDGAYLPMSAVAGDFYDLSLCNGRLVVIIADVSGHGVPAALVASMMKVAFAAESERYDEPGDILAGINRALTGKFERAYVTAFCVAIDRARGTLAYAAAGHPPALVRRRDGRVDRLAEGGIILTLVPDALYETTSVPFETGDYVLLFTDGLLEAARHGTEEFFGDNELHRVVGRLSSRNVVQAVLDAHRGWIGPEAPLADDVTIVSVQSVAEE